MPAPITTTSRLKLFALESRHLAPMVAMHLDEEVMRPIGGIWNRERTEEYFKRYQSAFTRDGLSRFAVEDLQGQFLGITGVLEHHDATANPGKHLEIGWRFCRSAWGKGIATEASAAALEHALQLRPTSEIWAYTTSDNLASQAVMLRLKMQRNLAQDFMLTTASGRIWDLKVWTARRAPA